MKYNFDEIINRANTNSYKYDLRQKMFGTNDVTPMWVADMDFKAAPEILDEIKKYTEFGIFGYTFHYDSLYKSIIQWNNNKNSWNISKNNIHFYHGVVPSINLIIKHFTKPGDGVLIHTPVYYPFFQSIENNKREIKNNSLIYKDGEYTIDFNHFESLIDKNTKLFILCHPHNPIGRVWTENELYKLFEICYKHNIIVVSDEIHSDILINNGTHIPFSKIHPKADEITITLMAPSKTFNIAGLAISAIISKNTDITNKITQAIKEDQLHGINSLGLLAFEAAYSKGEPWLFELLQYLQENYNTLSEYVSEHIPSIKLIHSQATYLAWLDCTQMNFSQEKLHKFFIEKAKVGLSNGATFGSGGNGFMRLNFACPKQVLIESLENIKKAINS